MYLLSAMVGYASSSSGQSTTIRPADVAPNSFGTFNFRELEEVIYDIEILKVPVPEPATNLGSTLDVEDSDGVHTTDDGNAGQTVVDLHDESEDRSDKTKTVNDNRRTHSEVLDWIRDTRVLWGGGCQMPTDVQITCAAL
jgi:hypothetical protein